MGEYISYPGLLAGASFASKQYYIAKIASTAGEVVPATSNTGELLGIIQNDPADGEPADVAIYGFAKASASTAITAGSYCTTNSTGQLVAATVDNTSIVAYAPIAAANLNDIIEVVLMPLQQFSTA